MAEIDGELIYEILKSIQQDVRLLKDGQAGIRQELISVRGQLVSINQDVNNIYGTLARHETHFDRIERRLELRELAEPQRSFDRDS